MKCMQLVRKVQRIFGQSLEKDHSKSTKSQDSSYLNESSHQMKSLFSNKTSWRKPINLYSMHLTKKDVKGLTKSSSMQDISHLVNEYSVQTAKQLKNYPKKLQQPHQSQAILNKKKLQSQLLKKERDLIALSNSMNYSYQKAIHDPLNKLKNYKRSALNISQDVINDYRYTNDPIKMRHSKRKYNKILDLFYEEKKECQRQSIIEREAIFNEVKASVYDVKKAPPKKVQSSALQKIAEQINSKANYDKAKQSYEVFNKKNNEEKAKRLADSICNVDCKPYREIDAKMAKKTFDKYHKQNLARAIRIASIENTRVDAEDMEYYLSNNKVLKSLLEKNQKNTQDEEQRQLKPNIVKRYFKQTTVNKVKMHNGFYFGVPV